jgi:SNF2 family DNA or RNA helicase
VEKADRKVVACKWALKQEWDLVVVDECQNIKSTGAKVSKFCAKLTARKKIAMSGTPITNGPLDAFGIYRFCDPGIFGQSYKRFERRYALTVDHNNYTTIAGYRNQDDFKNCFDFLCLQIESGVLDLPPLSFSAEVLQTLLEGLGEPVVVFGRFRHDLDECARVCRVLKRSYSEISGKRKELAGWTDILGVQIQTGRTGIDLTRASIAIFLSTGYSSGDYEQAIARLHRPPQKKPVRIINIHCAKTIDKKIAQILRDKKNVVDNFRACKKNDSVV